MMPAAQASSLFEALKTIGEPNRLQILFHLGMECRPVTDIINSTGLPQTNVSFHLRILREGGFVRAERRGAFIYYCLDDPKLLRILNQLKEWLELRESPSSKAETSPRARSGNGRLSRKAVQS